VVFEIQEQTDTQIYRQTDTLITILRTPTGDVVTRFDLHCTRCSYPCNTCIKGDWRKIRQRGEDCGVGGAPVDDNDGVCT